MFQHVKNLLYRLLRRGEKYTGTDNVYLAKGGFWMSAANVIASLSSFTLALLFARLVPKQVYGAYQYAVSWGSILTLTSLTGMGSALMRSVARGQGGTIHAIVRTRLRWSLIGSAIAVAGGAYYFWRGRPDLAAAVVAVGICMPLHSALSSWGDYLLGKKRFELQSSLAAFETIAAAAALILVMTLAPSAPALAAAYGLAHLGASAFAYRYALKTAPSESESDPEAASYGMQLSKIDAIANIAAYVDRIIVFTLLGASETAVYAFATAPPEQLKGYLKNVYFIAFPKIAGRSLQEMRATFFRKCLVMGGIVLAIALAYAGAAPVLYPILFPNYHESILLTQVFVLSLPSTVAVLPVALFNGHKLVKENATYQIASSCVSILLLFILTWRFGLIGTVLARVIGRYFGVALSMALAASVFRRAKSTAIPI